MACSENVCCRSQTPKCCKFDDVERRARKMFHPTILSSEIQLKTRIKPMSRTLDLSLTHDIQKNTTAWEVVAHGDLHDRIKAKARASGDKSCELSLTFNHPKIPDTTALLSTSLNYDTECIVPKLEISKRFEHFRLNGKLSTRKICGSSSCCIGKSTAEISALFHHRSIRGGISLSTCDLIAFKETSLDMAARFHEGPFIATISTQTFKKFTGSLIYKHDPSFCVGAEASYDMSTKLYESHLAFAKKVRPDSKMILRISSDATALMNLKHRLSEYMTLNISNEFMLKGDSKPSKFGFGLELSA
ncbi:hypothetical protein RF11_06473 [Thelohanellus kitauei]|uniref:Uncharacterized protein n=1 Tax=Thelohanellus kitauei TaxID=669202 RepID=A0A0C2MAG3_THEKT|nr:hypothetical protein RF11_06473 [Thelohanellus kitauei]